MLSDTSYQFSKYFVCQVKKKKNLWLWLLFLGISSRQFLLIFIIFIFRGDTIDVEEDAGTVYFTVERGGGNIGVVTVDWTTVPDTAISLGKLIKSFLLKFFIKCDTSNV